MPQQSYRSAEDLCPDRPWKKKEKHCTFASVFPLLLLTFTVDLSESKCAQTDRNVFTLRFLSCGFNANSCRGSHRVLVGSALVCVWIYMLNMCERVQPAPASAAPDGVVLFPGCRCCSEITSCRLPHRVLYPWVPAFSCPQGRGNYRKQDEHPGRVGVTRGREWWKERVMTLEIEGSAVDTWIFACFLCQNLIETLFLKSYKKQFRWAKCTKIHFSLNVGVSYLDKDGDTL